MIWQQKISYRFLNIRVLWGLPIGCFSNEFEAQFWLFVLGLFVGISFEDINWRYGYHFQSHLVIKFTKFD